MFTITCDSNRWFLPALGMKCLSLGVPAFRLEARIGGVSSANRIIVAPKLHVHHNTREAE